MGFAALNPSYRLSGGGNAMPVATIRGVDIHHEILGERGPFIALQPGGRRAGTGVRSLGEKIAEAGHRVIVYDRRNCGASGIAIEGESENDEWAEDLHELLGRLGALPAYIGGSSSGCRLAMILALRRPEDVRGLLLWRGARRGPPARRLATPNQPPPRQAAGEGGEGGGSPPGPSGGGEKTQTPPPGPPH